MHPNTTTLFPENPPAVTSSALSLDAPGLPVQGDFLFSDDPIVNWFDSQTEETARFWLDRAVELFGLPDSATPRQCWAAFCAFATRGVRAPQLLTHAALIRKHGQPRFTVDFPPGVLYSGNVVPFWSETAFKGYLAGLSIQGYLVTFSAFTSAFAWLPSVAQAASLTVCPRCGGPLSAALEPYCSDPSCLWNSEEEWAE